MRGKSRKLKQKNNSLTFNLITKYNNKIVLTELESELHKNDPIL